MSEPMIIGVDFGNKDKDSAVLGVIRRDGVQLIYTLAEGETCISTARGFVICHPDRPPKLLTTNGIEEIELQQGAT
jgi:hypothetical protein